MARKPDVTRQLADAVTVALTGDWQSAHEVAQQHEDDEHACWLHAIVHRMEGDLGNARYWYGRCGRSLREQISTEAELRELKAALAERERAARRS